MANIRTVHDSKRGCGWRKGGGLYLMSGGLADVCYKLPVECVVCPCCNHGIKPAMGFTWVSHEIVSSVKCPAKPEFSEVKKMGKDNCKNCYGLNGDPEKLGLIWIGEKYYKTPGDFTRECDRQGVSRRISRVPRNFTVGEDVILLGHRKCNFGIDEKGRPILKPGIFRTFKPERIEYVVTGNETEDELNALEKRGLDLVKVVRVEEKDGDIFETNNEVKK